MNRHFLSQRRIRAISQAFLVLALLIACRHLHWLALLLLYPSRLNPVRLTRVRLQPHQIHWRNPSRSRLAASHSRLQRLRPARANARPIFH